MGGPRAPVSATACYACGAAGFVQGVDLQACECEKSDGLVFLFKKRFAGGDERLIRSRGDVEKVHVDW